MIVIYLAKTLWLRRAGDAADRLAIRPLTPTRPWLEIADLPMVVPRIGTTSGARLRRIDPNWPGPIAEVEGG